MVRDLYLQWFQRKADFHTSAREFLEAEKIIRDLKTAFESTPSEEIDHKSRARLMRSGSALTSCIMTAAEPGKRRELITLYLWLQEEAGIRPSIITAIDKRGGIATLTNPAGIEQRFLKEELLPPEDWDQLQVGRYVFHESFGRDERSVSGVILAR